jgi:hypothetical protein
MKPKASDYGQLLHRSPHDAMPFEDRSAVDGLGTSYANYSRDHGGH